LFQFQITTEFIVDLVYEIRILHTNWLVLNPFGIAVIALIAFVVIRNQKDEKILEKELITDDSKSKEKKSDYRS
jgi:hypothetical protein